jgi:hypothetical protein
MIALSASGAACSSTSDESAPDGGSPSAGSGTDGGSAGDSAQPADSGEAGAPTSISSCDGTYSLAPAAGVPFTATPTVIAAADVNKDGKTDLLSLVNGVGAVVALSNGDGTFKTPVPSGGTVFGGGANLAVGDLDGDGAPDLVVSATQGGNTVYKWQKNNGDGTFAPEQMLQQASDSARSSTLADVSGDGLVDLVVLGSNSVLVLVNEGKGAFAAPVTYSQSTSAAWEAALAPTAYTDPLGLVVADLDGDGLLDLAFSQDTAGGVFVSLNGHGSFEDPVPYAGTTGFTPATVVAADLDGDGHVDLALLGRDNTTTNLNVFTNQGKGTFATGKGAALPAVGLSGTDLLATDLDGDGHPDLIAFYNAGGGPWVFLNDGKGNFPDALTYSAGPAPDDALCLAVGTFSGDGVVSLAVLQSEPSTALPNGGVDVLLGSCSK